MRTKLILTSGFILIAYLLGTVSLYSQCSNCGGRGTLDCIRCAGNGSYPCTNCGGAGGTWEACNCNNGYVTMSDGTQQLCNYCLGEGRKWHSCFNPLCSGGTVNCNFCGGDGQVDCPSCN